MDYAEYLKSEHWHEVSQNAKRSAGWKCQLCNGTVNLDVHHRTYERIGNELLSDLICLCHICHEIFHFDNPQLTDTPLPPVIIFSGKSDSAWGNE